MLRLLIVVWVAIAPLDAFAKSQRPDWNWYLVTPSTSADFGTFSKLTVFRLGTAVVEKSDGFIRVEFSDPKLPMSRMRFTGRLSKNGFASGILDGIDLDGDRKLPLVGQHRVSTFKNGTVTCVGEELRLQSDSGADAPIADGFVLVLLRQQEGRCRVW